MANVLSDALVVLITFPSPEAAQTIATALVNERLAACVNVVSGIRSVFIWEGSLQDAPEVLGIVKTSQERLDSLIERVKSLHPYTVPEIIAMPIVGGDDRYLTWVRDAVDRPKKSI